MKFLTELRRGFCAAAGILGGWIASVLGGWNAALGALVSCMAVDYLTGLMVAGIFHNSPKSANGGLESRVGRKGLIRKFVTLLIVLMAHQMDVLMGVSYVRDAVIIGFCANECISILENAGRMGLPIPKMLTGVLDQLNEQSENPRSR